MRRSVYGFAVATCLALAGRPAAAQAPAPTSLTLQGRLEHPVILTLAELQAMPPVTVEVSHTGHNGVQTTRYTGVLLWTLLQTAKPIDQNGPRTHLQHVFHAAGHDGYAVAIAIGELDPDFEGKQVLVAYGQDGRPLPSLKLVVPADIKAGRSVRDLVSIEAF